MLRVPHWGESVAHSILKEKAVRWLDAQGYDVEQEYRIEVQGVLYRVDVVGFKGRYSVAIECGHTSIEKWALLGKYFDEVRVFHYSMKIRPGNKDLLRSALSLKRARTTIHGRGKCQVPLMARLALNIKDDDHLVWYQQGNMIIVDKANEVVDVSNVFGRGKTQIPADVRRIMGLKDGTKIVWKLENGKMTVGLA